MGIRLNNLKKMERERKNLRGGKDKKHLKYSWGSYKFDKPMPPSRHRGPVQTSLNSM